MAASLKSLQYEGVEREVHELRLSRKWRPPGTDEEASAWMLTLGLPLHDEDGRVILTMGFLSDISHQKWSELVQTRSAAQAMQAKRQQEVCRLVLEAIPSAYTRIGVYRHNGKPLQISGSKNILIDFLPVPRNAEPAHSDDSASRRHSWMPQG